MSNIRSIVNVQVSRTNKTVSQAGFGTALILGPNAVSLTKYTDMEGVSADFLISTAEWIAANAYFAQALQPEAVYIGARTAKVAQVETITPTAVNSATYTVTLNGVDHTFVADSSATIAEIVTGLIAALGSPSGIVLSGTTTLILTGTAGVPFTVSVGANLALVHTTPVNGVVNDIQTADLANDDWYMLILCSRLAADIEAAAAYIESQFKMAMFCTVDAAVLTTGTTDVAYLLKAGSFDRSALLFATNQITSPEAGWAGGVLPMDPGSETWKFKTIKGSLPETRATMTDTQEANAAGKNCNIYTTVGGVNMTSEGVVASGEFIDVIRFIDWLTARITEKVFGRLVSLPKVPFTDTGVSQIEGDIRAVLKEGIRKGGLANDGSVYVNVPLVADVSTQDRAARFLEGIEFGGNLAGAIHKAKIVGKISV